MNFSTTDLTPLIGTEVRTDRATLLGGSIAQDIRALLEQRGVLLFRGYDLTNEEQLQFARTLGTPRNEHGTDMSMSIGTKATSGAATSETESPCGHRSSAVVWFTGRIGVTMASRKPSRPVTTATIFAVRLDSLIGLGLHPDRAGA